MRIALVGNPNSGKSSLFNHLTGLNQKVGNFSGVTVDKKTGFAQLSPNLTAEVIDLPGTYSIYPHSADEKVVFNILGDRNNPLYPNKVVVIVDASNLKRNLLLFTQIHDLGIPCVLALNMMDLVRKLGLSIDHERLSKVLCVPVIAINARKGKGLHELKQVLARKDAKSFEPVLRISDFATEAIDRIKDKFSIKEDYYAYQLLQQNQIISTLSEEKKEAINAISDQYNFKRDELRRRETLARYEKISKLIDVAVEETFAKLPKPWTQKLDAVLTHKVYGYLLFLGILFLIFQSIFAWAEAPMNLIDTTFSDLSVWLSGTLPPGALTNLLTEGIIAGIGGVIIFIPQIAILFAFISILEETGYMARVVFMMDKVMSKFGLNGRSVVPLITGVACAIPAVMATRTIENWKERLITLFVTPLMSCAARLPVYTIIIALIIPEEQILGVFNLQGFALLGMYLIGLLAALISAAAMKAILTTKERSFLVMELPVYKTPRWANVVLTMYEKSKTFVIQAGKIILAISIILWVLASYGPSAKMDNADEVVKAKYPELSGDELANEISAYRLENSYAGIFGKTLEPVIKPLGYDWKIGIALITSFAAREVFVGTMSTIYSIGGTDDEATVKKRMENEINPDTGLPRYDFATGFSLLIFYAFAMQCMSTLAVVYRETKGWKWPMLQLVYMSGLAYLSALVVYQIFN
ncbi:MAG: ferrous iron transport protein B [Bacteroidota bacterium]